MRVIGISNKTRYWQLHVFQNPPEGYRYSRAFDVPWHVLRLRQQFVLHTKLFMPFKHIDIYHTYNSIVVNPHPWVIEVESYLPRYKPMREDHPLFKWGLKRLASKHCKHLVFTSENTRRMNEQRLIDNGVDPSKMSVVYRAVEQFLPGEKDPDRFTILFAGNGFYRKGGMELLKAFLRLNDDDAQLWIVSSMEVDWEIFPTDEEIAWVHKTIAEHPRITHWAAITHSQLVQTMRKAHLFISTTFSDPFNNTILEAMGCQLPVIGSNVSSVPEMIEHEGNGFVVQVDKQDKEHVVDQLVDRINAIKDDPTTARRFADRSLQIVRQKFDLSVRNKALAGIYEKALT